MRFNEKLSAINYLRHSQYHPQEKRREARREAIRQKQRPASTTLLSLRLAILCQQQNLARFYFWVLASRDQPGSVLKKTHIIIITRNIA